MRMIRPVRQQSWNDHLCLDKKPSSDDKWIGTPRSEDLGFLQNQGSPCVLLLFSRIQSDYIQARCQQSKHTRPMCPLLKLHHHCTAPLATAPAQVQVSQFVASVAMISNVSGATSCMHKHGSLYRTPRMLGMGSLASSRRMLSGPQVRRGRVMQVSK